MQYDENGLQVEAKIGNINPVARYDLQNTFRYKGVRVYGQIAGQIGGDVYNNYKQSLYVAGLHTDLDQTGKPDEQRKPVSYYRALAQSNCCYLKEFVEDGTYARLSEAGVGYEMNANKFAFVRRVGAKRIEVDLVGRNLFTATGYSGLNPQTGSYGAYDDNIRYPLTRTFTLATSIIF